MLILMIAYSRGTVEAGRVYPRLSGTRRALVSVLAARRSMYVLRLLSTPVGRWAHAKARQRFS